MSIKFHTDSATLETTVEKALVMVEAGSLYFPSVPRGRMAELTWSGVKVHAYDRQGQFPGAGSAEVVHLCASLRDYMAIVEATNPGAGPKKFWDLSRTPWALRRQAIWDWVECYAPSRMYTWLRQHVPAAWR